MGRLKVRKSIPGMHQHTLYMSTPEYNRVVKQAGRGASSVNTFILEAIARELERREDEQESLQVTI